MPAWDDLAPGEQRVCARLQEAFAGFMTHTDAQVGRLLEFLVGTGIADDTLVVLLSDNGASGEGGRLGSLNEYRYFLGLPDVVADTIAGLDHIGGPAAHNHYPSGRAQGWKLPGPILQKQAFAGGVRVPLIISWPGHTATGANLPQFHHVMDIAATIWEATGTRAPETCAAWPSCRCTGCR